MGQELLSGQDACGDAGADHEAVEFFAFPGLRGSAALFAVVLLVSTVKLEELQVVFSEMR